MGLRRTVTDPLMSPNRIIRVLAFSPSEGYIGTMITVTVQFTLRIADTTFLRIVIGGRALSTTVRPATDGEQGKYELVAAAPAIWGTSEPLSVPLAVQALNGLNTTLDSVTFGRFTYRLGPPELPPALVKAEESDDWFPPSSADYAAALEPARTASRRASPPGGPVRTRDIVPTQVSAARELQTARSQLGKRQSLIRARRDSSVDAPFDASCQAALVLETPLEPLGVVDKWSEEEQEAGRRLVRFSRVQQGVTLHVSCEAIRPEEYMENEAVVSCIRRPADSEGDASACCITSVDIIFLLECLVSTTFNIEEKNRIRRNLEGFRPKTVSKSKHGSEAFFQTIMEFGAPKPRNIEKDVKVFDWSVLGQALDKIISKYTLQPVVKHGSPFPSTSGQARNPSPPLQENSATTSHPSYVPYQQPVRRGSRQRPMPVSDAFELPSGYSMSESPPPSSLSSPFAAPMYPPGDLSSGGQMYGQGGIPHRTQLYRHASGDYPTFH